MEVRPGTPKRDGIVSAMNKPAERGPGHDGSALQEELLLESVLHHQVGADPSRLGEMLDLAAVGMVNEAWRNGPVENWHAGAAPLSDGDMLRINAHTTWRVRGIVRRWRADMGLATSAPAGALDSVGVEATDLLGLRIWRWLVNPARQLPIGCTLAELAGEDLDQFRDHAEDALVSFADQAECRGTRYAVWRTAAHGGLACRHWWGTPGWPRLVRTFLGVLDDPSHQHWGPGAERLARLGAQPMQVADRRNLQRTLLREPWTLDPEAADWIAAAGIGFLRAPPPALPAEPGTGRTADSKPTRSGQPR
jgi:hypothetical protein